MISINRWKILCWISLSELFALSLWFSASAILPELMLVWDLRPIMGSWITISVQIGFIIGALISALFGISDRFNSRKVFVVSAFAGAVINSLLIFASAGWVAFLIRFLTGITLAGAYPTAVKLISQWFPIRRGTAVGILIAALTLGSALPHFITVFFSVNWKLVILASSVLALASSAIMNWLVADSPVSTGKTSVSIHFLKKVFVNKPVMLANYGYFGHMWELYAMWTWLPSFLIANLKLSLPEAGPWVSSLLSFLAIGVAGAAGCVIGGFFADKIGKRKLTIIAMATSAFCAVAIGFTFQFSIWAAFIVSIIWGMSVIADSAQFSAAVTEYSEEGYVGTALTFQMAIGFLITVISIQLIPILQKQIGWEWVFTLLSIGPILGIIAMHRLRKFEKA